MFNSPIQYQPLSIPGLSCQDIDQGQASASLFTGMELAGFSNIAVRLVGKHVEQAKKILENVVSITEHQDNQQFRRNLGMSVREMITMDEIAFVRPQSTVNEKVAFTLTHIDSALPSHYEVSLRSLIEDSDSILTPENIVQMMSEGHRLLKQEGSVITLLPVIYKERLIEIIVVSASSMSSEALFLLKGYARLYRNFIGLIIESQTDGLTGLLNRKAMESRLAIILDEAQRKISTARIGEADKRTNDEAKNAYLAVIDIDHFKNINDTMGHLFGDEVIILVARLMQEVFRSHDLIFRFGGEEFVAVLLTPDHAGAVAALERFRKEMAAHRFPQLDAVTVSIGFVEVSDKTTPAELIGRADQALYYAKEHGRNQVCEYEQLIADGQLKTRRSKQDIELF